MPPRTARSARVFGTRHAVQLDQGRDRPHARRGRRRRGGDLRAGAAARTRCPAALNTRDAGSGAAAALPAGEPRAARLRRVHEQSFGFGGTNCSLVLRARTRMIDASFVEGIGLLGPGLAGWAAARAVPARRAAVRSRARRRCRRRRAAAAGRAAPRRRRREAGAGGRRRGASRSRPRSGGACRPCSPPPAATARQLPRDLRGARRRRARSSRRPASTTRCTTPPSGYWSIATGSHGSRRTSLCAYDASFAAGLLEALTQVVVERQPGRCWSPTTCPIPSRCHARAADPAMPSASPWCFAAAAPRTHSRASRSRLHLSDAPPDTSSRMPRSEPARGDPGGPQPAAAGTRSRAERRARGHARLPANRSRSPWQAHGMRLLDRDWIERTSRTRARMCLLDAGADLGCARASAAAAPRHRDPDNPLRAHGRLGAVCGIEYAAQAMAVHGALAGATGDDTRRPRGLPGERAQRAAARRATRRSRRPTSSSKRARHRRRRAPCCTASRVATASGAAQGRAGRRCRAALERYSWNGRTSP